MKISTAKTGVYIPKWNGNKEQPEDEQIKINYKNLTTEQIKKLSGLRDIEITSGGEIKGDPESKIFYRADKEKAFKLAVESIENLEGDEGAINTAEKLLSSPDTCGLSSLVDEVGQFILMKDNFNKKK